MKKLFKRPRLMIPLLCYGVAAAIWLVTSLAFLLGDATARAGGKLTPREIPLSEIEMVALEPQQNGGWLAVHYDPQMIWLNTEGKTVRSLTLHAEFSGTIGEMALYYIQQNGEVFGREQRVMPVENGDGSYTFHLPRAQVYALRLDPCSNMQLVENISVELNTDCPVTLYFARSWKQLFFYLLLPGLAACALDLGRETFQKCKRRG